MALRVGIGHDTHRLGPDRPLILGGHPVPFDRGLVGHSDADVLLHAVIDALLGATGQGDIGDWFPDTDPAHAGVDSRLLLREVLSRLGQAVEVLNVDCILFAEQPKLGMHKASIRASLATLLGISDDRVNVKAKSGEKVGPIGRGEAISAEVIVLIDRHGPISPPPSGPPSD